MDAVTQLLAQLVAIDSINPDLAAGAAGEAAVAHFVADWLTRAGLEVQLDEVRPGRPNVVAVARGSGGGRSLMLNGHTDTVGVLGMAAPHQPRVEGDRMYGRGTYDMKGGLAACMLAAAQARSRPLRGDVILTAVIDEEWAGLGTLDVAARYRADAALVAEPTELQLVVAHKGFVWLEIETQGVAAHGSRPDLGIDAVTKMGHLLVALDAHNAQLLAQPRHPLLGSGSLHASLISGGQEMSSFPARCTLAVERRTIPGETPETVEAELTALIDGLAARDPQFSARLRRTLACPPLETPPDGPIVTQLAACAAAVLGQPAQPSGVTYWTDAASLTAAGIPAVLFGPCGAGAHAIEEWVSLSSVASCAEIYRRLIDAWCA